MNASRLRRFRRIVTAPPRALVSPRFLLPRLSAEQRVHRSLLRRAFTGERTSVAVVVMLLSWVHWITFGARRRVDRASKRWGDAVATEFGIDVSSQRRRMLGLALLHSIPPTDAYELELFVPERRTAMWEYVYSTEVGAFHRWRSERHGSPAAAVEAERALLSDKQATCEALTELGVVVPNRIDRLQRGSSFDSFQHTIGASAVFCRPNTGNAAKGAFSARVADGVLDIEPVIGKRPDDQVEYVERFLTQGDLLVEQLVRPHADFAALDVPDDVAVVLRVITEAGTATCGFVEIPLRIERETGSALLFASMSIDLDTGCIISETGAGWRRRADALVDRKLAELCEAAAGTVVPCFGESIEAAERAASVVPATHGVAWDVAIGPSGPVVLEGNTGWSVSAPQQILGPLVVRELLVRGADA